MEKDNVEKNVKNPTAGHCDHSRWTGDDRSCQDTCIALFSQGEEIDDALLKAVANRLASGPACDVYGFYVCTIDIGRYGEVDHLAPEPAKREFVTYVQKQNQEMTERLFAPVRLLSEHAATSCTLQVVPDKTEVRTILKNLKKRYQSVMILP